MLDLAKCIGLQKNENSIVYKHFSSTCTKEISARCLEARLQGQKPILRVISRSAPLKLSFALHQEDVNSRSCKNCLLKIN